MSLEFRLSVGIMSALFVSQLVLRTEAQTATSRTPRSITFDCNPEQLEGDGVDRIVTPDPGACLPDPPDPINVPPELFGPGGPVPFVIACNQFKTPSLWGVRHTAPYFHDNSSKTLKEVAEQYTFMFRLFSDVIFTPQDEADIVAFLRLL